MKKNIVLIASMLLLVGCAESIALLGGASNGKIMQSSLKTGLSLGIKKQTGSSPIEHVLTLAKRTDQKICDTLDKKKPESCNTITNQITSTKSIIDKKKRKINNAKSDAKNQIVRANNKVKKIVSEKKESFKRKFAKARKEGKDSFIYNNKIYNTAFKKSDVTEETNKTEKSAKELALIVQTTIKEKSKIKYLD
jgi:hypothetical protein